MIITYMYLYDIHSVFRYVGTYVVSEYPQIILNHQSRNIGTVVSTKPFDHQRSKASRGHPTVKVMHTQYPCFLWLCAWLERLGIARTYAQ